MTAPRIELGGLVWGSDEHIDALAAHIGDQSAQLADARAKLAKCHHPDCACVHCVQHRETERRGREHG